MSVIDTSTEAAAVGAIVPYFGAKRTLSPVIVAEFGEHDNYFEVFCGSCAVLLAKPPCRMEYVNDFNGDLVNLIRVVQHDVLGPKLYRQCRRMIMAEATFRAAAEEWKARGRQPADFTREPDFEAAVSYFYTSWVGRNGVVGTSSYNQGFAARFTGRGGHAGTRWLSSVDSIPAWRRRMRGVVVLSRCGIELADRVEDEAGTVVYADPPYIVKGAEYIHDFTPEHHRQLAAVLNKKRKSRVVVSYYEHPLLDELYPPDRWTKVQCPTTKSMVCGNRPAGESGGAVVAPEVLLINGPSLTQSKGLFG